MYEYPFDTAGITRDARGIKHYTGQAGSVPEMLRRTVERSPNAEAVVELGGERLSYRELWERAARVAGGLRAAGVGRGDRVAIRLPNGLHWVLAYFGTLFLGAVAVPVNTRFTEEEAAYVVNDSGAGYVCRDDAPLPDGPPVVFEETAPSDLAAIFYTSGTTGFPKGAMLSHGNFLTNAENARRVRNLPADGGGIRNLVSVPLFHVTGCNSQLLPTSLIGGTTVIMPRFEVQAFLGAIRDERISLLTSVPAIYWLAIHQPEFATLDVSGVRWATYGGAPIAPELVRRIMASFPNASVGNGFGLTETSSVTTYLPHAYAADHADSVGFPVPTADLDLFEPDAEGVGELLVRGANVVSGYWRKPEASAATFTDGWLHTGDLARIDSRGLTYIADRKKDMINRGGENVYSVEVENVLAGHPDVFEVAVLGVPDEVMGEKVGALIVAKPDREPDIDDILAFARKHLADFKVPQYIASTTQPLPRNPGGKVVKPRIRGNVDWGRPLR